MLSPTFSSVLAIVVALASLFLFLMSFIAPRLYRAQDLWWSGVGLFYALVLWFCSAQIRGAVLLGTIASVSLLGWLSSQVYLSRWALLTDAEKAGGTLKRLQALGQQLHRLLESRPSQAAAPQTKTQTATQSPEVAQPDPISKNTGIKTGKVRWVRPEKTKASQDAPVESQTDGSLSDSSLTDTPITDLSKDSQAIVDPLETSAPAETSEPIQPLEPIVPSESQPEEAIVSPFAESTLVAGGKTVDEWDEMEADLEDGGEEATSEKTQISSGTPKTEANAQPEPKTGIVKRIQNFFQGRKSHGKRFVRPEDEVASKPVPRPEPSSVETAPPELSELPTPETIEIPTNLTPDPISEITAIPEPSKTENTQEPLATSESSNVSEDPTLQVSPEDIAPETPEDVALETPEDVAPEASEDVAPEASEDAASEVPEDVAPETPEDVVPKTSEEIPPEDIAPKDGTPETIETTNTSAVERG